MTEGDKSGDGDNNAEALARAEEAAASLLAAVGDEKEATSTAEAATNETCEKKAAAGDQARAEESAATTDEVRAEEAAAALLAELDLEGTKSSARKEQKEMRYWISSVLSPKSTSLCIVLCSNYKGPTRR